MRNHRGLLSAVVAAIVLQCQYAHAQDDDGGGGGRGDREDRNDSRNSNCTSTITDAELRGTLNVTARCQLIGSEVRGDVIIFAGGSLLARDTRFRGSIEASRADFVELVEIRVDRNVSLRELVGDSSRIESSDLRGNVVLTSNRSRFEIVDNQFAHDVGAFGNTGGLRIAGNAIDGDLLCTGNVPAPTLLGNRIGGDAEGQCGAPRPPPAADPTPPRPTPTPTPAPASPPATPPPSGSSAPPSTPTMPTASPPATPEPTTAPAAAPPATAAPPPPEPTNATPPAEVLDDGGAGAIDWSLVALLLPLVAWRRPRRANALST